MYCKRWTIKTYYLKCLLENLKSLCSPLQTAAFCESSRDLGFSLAFSFFAPVLDRKSLPILQSRKPRVLTSSTKIADLFLCAFWMRLCNEVRSMNTSRPSKSLTLFVEFWKLITNQILRAAPPKYQLNQEIAKKWNFFKLAQNEVLRAPVTKISV